ncbi:MAG: hypothetical protein IJN90_03030 [Bacilli bacterium]|nr:hypothetical protein [Bacilli bacterium]
MKEASGELNMTIVTVVAIALILAFATMFVPDILEGIQEKWNIAEQDAQEGLDNKDNTYQDQHG